jgi:hypothetical protein
LVACSCSSCSNLLKNSSDLFHFRVQITFIDWCCINKSITGYCKLYIRKFNFVSNKLKKLI